MRYGIKLLWGELLPETVKAAPFIFCAVPIAVAKKLGAGRPPGLAQSIPLGSVAVPAVFAFTVWPCPGISAVVNAIVSEPPVWPRSYSDKPGPCPGCNAAEPSRFGRAKLLLPFP